MNPINVAAKIIALCRTFRARRKRMEGIFSFIYKHNLWENEESVSGRGSTLARTTVIRKEIPSLFKELNVHSLLDAPCGDFNWMRQIELELEMYIGVDVVPELIFRNNEMFASPTKKFILLDISKDTLPSVDVILCRDCLIHFSLEDIDATIKNFKRSKSKYLLATNHIDVKKNVEIRTGEWRSVNLQLPPFNFPAPLKLIIEDA